MPTMPSFILLLILLAPFTSMRACHGRLLRDHQIQPENQGTSVIHGKQDIESNSLKRDQWMTSGGAATTKSLKDKKTLTSTKAENQEAVKTILSGSMDVLAPSPAHAGYTETSQSMVLSEEQEHQTIDQHDQEGTITMNDSLSMDYQLPRRGPSVHNK